MDKRFQIRRIVLDVICLLVVYIPWLCIIYFPQPYQRGFFCGDESIAHPYKDSTISTLVLSIVGVGLPIITFLITEGTHVKLHNKRHVPDPPYIIGEKAFPNYVYRCYKIIGCFLFGLGATMVTTDTAKYCVGRLRPHFLDICKPNYSQFECLDERGFQVYILGDFCTGTDERKMKESRLSFPSGHASISMYCMIYAAMYVHARFNWKGSKLLCPVLEFIFFVLAFFTCLSRISDYKHHWSDVLGGALIGIFYAVVTIIHLLKLLPVHRATIQPSSGQAGNQIHTRNVRPISKVTYLTDDEPSPQISVTQTSQNNFPNSYRGDSYYGNSYVEHPDYHGNQDGHSYSVQL